MIDAMRDIAPFETEFIISDLSILETRIDRIKRQLQKTQEELLKKELPVLEKCHQILQTEKPLRDVELTKEDVQILKTYQLLSIKPMLIALNFDESQRPIAESTVKRAAEKKESKNTKVMSFFGKIEMEMSELPDDERKVFMEEYGIKQSALDTLIRESYALLGLRHSSP